MHVLYNILNTHISENHSFHTFLIVDDTKYLPHRNKTYGDTFCLKSKKKKRHISAALFWSALDVCPRPVKISLLSCFSDLEKKRSSLHIFAVDDPAVAASTAKRSKNFPAIDVDHNHSWKAMSVPSI